MANGNGISFTSSYTGKEMLNPATNKPFQTLDEYLAHMDGGSSAKKTANKIIESVNTASIPSMEGVAPTSIDYRKNGDSKTTFKNGGEKEAAAGGKKLDEVASKYAEEKFTPTGIWEYDLGYALGRSRKKKIEAAGGKEAFKSAKKQKRSETTMRTVGKLQSTFGIGSYGKDKKQQRKESKAIAKEKKSFKPMAKMPTSKVSSPLLRKVLGSIEKTPLNNKKEVKGLPKNSNPYKPF